MIPRFMKEYASYRVKECMNIHTGEQQAEAIRRITKALTSYDKGYLTVKEAMTMIMEAGNDE